MIKYLQVTFKVRHSDDRTTFTITTLISFEYVCPYNQIQVWRTYILTNIVKAVEPDAQDPELCSELHNLVVKL